MPLRLVTSNLNSSCQALRTLLIVPRCTCHRSYSPRLFSSTPQHETRQRRAMFRWLNGPGAVFREPLSGSTNYLNAYDSDGRLIRINGRSKPKDDGDEEKLSELPDEDVQQDRNVPGSISKETEDDLIPFPMNRQFRSQPVLSDDLKEEIWKRVMSEGKSIRTVSAQLGVEMNRVGAVVRLKSIEKEWVKQSQPLANAYARSITGMLPQTPLRKLPVPHESINDLPVHRDTLPQLFYPVSESRHFTRADAAKVFSPSLLPADDRIPHPELIELERDIAKNMPKPEIEIRQGERTRLEAVKIEERERKKRERFEQETTRVVQSGGRWEFRFQDISVDAVGEMGRDKRGVGARYGVPHQDRKRGQIKIPTRVEV